MVKISPKVRIGSAGQEIATRKHFLKEGNCRRAAEFLLDAITGQPHPGTTSVTPRLVVRDSTLSE